MKPGHCSSREETLYIAIHNLSLPAGEALANTAQGEKRPDSLALSFDEQYTLFMESMTALPGDAQLLSLQALDAALNAISGPENLALWTEASFSDDPQWETIRTLAREVLVAFDW